MNLFGSFASAYPSAGSFSRSALNDECEATSPVSVLTVAVLVAFVLRFAMPLFKYLPKCTLSAIVVVALVNLADPDELAWLWKNDRKDLALWWLTFLSVLFTGVEIGILIGVLGSIFLTVLENWVLTTTRLRRLRDTRLWVDASQYNDYDDDEPSIHVLRVEGAFTFLTAGQVGQKLEHLVKVAAEQRREGQPAIEKVVVDLGGSHYIDSTGLHYLEEALVELNRGGILVALSNPTQRVLHKLYITGLLNKFNRQFGVESSWVFASTDDAVLAVGAWVKPAQKDKAPKGDDASTAESGDIESHGTGEERSSSDEEERKGAPTSLIPTGMPLIGNLPGAVFDKSSLAPPNVDKNKPPSVRVLADGGGSGQMAAWTLDVYNKMMQEKEQKEAGAAKGLDPIKDS